jgi:hypothetical protein
MNSKYVKISFREEIDNKFESHKLATANTTELSAFCSTVPTLSLPCIREIPEGILNYGTEFSMDSLTIP